MVDTCTGANAPLKRCQTTSKEWDINFEGLAHYGLIADFIQDLSNVGLNAEDMSPLFHLAEAFARMWVKSMEGGVAFRTPKLEVTIEQAGPATLAHLGWFADERDILEIRENLNHPNSWTPCLTNVIVLNGYKRITLPVDRDRPGCFYRVRRDPRVVVAR
jgi:hypothetical protein